MVTLAVAGWLMWVLPGPQMGAVLGFGPVDGVVEVDRCYEAPAAEGWATGTDCAGWYTPRRPGEEAREIVLDTAADAYRRGAEVEVRTARGRAYELSGTAVFNFGTAAGLLLVPFLTFAAWLFACARSGTVRKAEGYFLVSLAGLFAAVVLGAVAGCLVGIGTAVF
ncbi:MULTISPECIES: hypothetical protein [unclassified Streptomyces]|uniref:hypothetical protein n=1 Tax=unclassified Streptomyces TaxID=2593676 RepID=UPI0012FF4C63|nr:hypothetical protein [Streptomyces sp. PCS3-D2]WKV72482.1 hypothetical protein AW27_013685 [Streptomyces sp. PCS3-D2]